MRVGIATYDTSPSQCWERLLWCENHNFLFGSAQPFVDHPPFLFCPALFCLVRCQPRSFLGNSISFPSGVRPVGGQSSPGGGR